MLGESKMTHAFHAYLNPEDTELNESSTFSEMKNIFKNNTRVLFSEKTNLITKKDEQGRPISVEATLKSTHSGKRSSTESKLQGSVGGDDRLEDDDGGHLIGHRFMSDQGIKNLFPQNSNLNRGVYKTMENEWADWTKEGYEVRLKVKLDPKGSSRPETLLQAIQ
ncbi:DNA/RNA non-specific endonuclease [Gallaecimonas pentaromativorans]|uniref:DNA/RNA non-specific endonuclease n=2 Tax=Gallaecimonas pentaromativorans TaxID=584787 RepID=A0A3N1PL41_9GAMM|nr:DNA/RNA non-specific endonuclease [Gallaecimonas pentaromativorans]